MTRPGQFPDDSVSSWSEEDKTITHPFGSLWTNRSRSIGFIRISKCASTSVTSACGLDRIEPIQGWNLGNPLFTILRDPTSRFLSSIPETFKRVFPQGILESDRLSRDVEVTQVIYEKIYHLSGCSPKTLIEGWLGLIAEHGFFDAHHEPMVYFLFRETDLPYGNPQLVPFQDVDRFIRFARSKNKDPKPRFVIQKNSRSPGKRSRALSLRRLTRPDLIWPLTERHPIVVRIAEQRGCPPRNALRELYKDLLAIRPHADGILKASGMYAGDFTLWDGLLAHVQNSDWPYLEEIRTSGNRI